MKNYSKKFKHIVPTFVIIVFGTTIATLLFRWLFTINSDLLPIKEDVFNIWLPLILPWVPMTIWLRPKLRIVKFKKGDASMLFQIICWGTLFGMMIASNGYLKTATGGLLELSSIEQSSKIDSRYLKLDKIPVDKDFGSVHTEFRASGKYNQYLNFDSYFVYPYDIITEDGKFKYWLGVKIHDQISNRLESKEKEIKYQAFFEKAVKEFEAYNFLKPSYFEILPHSEDREGFLKAIRRQDKVIDSNLIVIEPKEGLYEERNGKKLEWVFGSFGIGFGVFLFALIFPKYHRAEHKRQLKGVKPKSDELVDLIKLLIPTKENFATPIIINLNILVFLIMVFSGVHIISPNGIELMEWGANRRPETMGGQWWRLLTSMFVHGGIMHLFLNIYGLIMAAIFVESYFGGVKYFIIYFVAGLCGSLASIYWYENTASVGASGAIFGLFGSILALTLSNSISKDEKMSLLRIFGPYVGISLLFGLTGGIDNAAHIGGLVSGAITGIVLHLTNQKAS